MKPLELAGQKFGALTVTQRVESDASGQSRWKCYCACGNTAIVRGQELRRGKTTSCGCRRREMLDLGFVRRTHGEAGKGRRRSPEYRIWADMLTRCRNPKFHAYARYGGRGITVCERWLKFENFLADMGRRPAPHLSIERINNDGNYEPTNCKWATKSEQVKNQKHPPRGYRGMFARVTDDERTVTKRERAAATA